MASLSVQTMTIFLLTKLFSGKNHYSQMPLASKTPNAGDILRSGMGGNFSPQLARARSKPRSIISTPTGDSFDDAPLPGSRRPRDTTDD